MLCTSDVYSSLDSSWTNIELRTRKSCYQADIHVLPDCRMDVVSTQQTPSPQPAQISRFLHADADSPGDMGIGLWRRNSCRNKRVSSSGVWIFMPSVFVRDRLLRALRAQVPCSMRVAVQHASPAGTRAAKLCGNRTKRKADVPEVRMQLSSPFLWSFAVIGSLSLLLLRSLNYVRCDSNLSPQEVFCS